MRLVVPDDLQPSPDFEVIRQALGLLIEPGQRFELRALPSKLSWVGDDIDIAVEAARGLAGGNLYYTLNPCRPDLKTAASKQDILARRWLLIDVDTRQSDADIMATEEEKRAAGELASAIRFDLKMRGWPDPVVVDSGNGFQLLYRIDLPNNRQAQSWIAAFLRSLAALFNSECAKVDDSVHDACRLARLPGTWNRKGKHSEDRPFRMAQLVSIPKTLGIVPPDLILAVARTKKEKAKPTVDAHPTAEGGAATTPPSGLRVPSMPDKDLSGWFKKALENEAAQVVLAEPGTRHNRLRAAARSLAGHLHHGHLDEAEVVRTLKLAGRRAGLDDKDIDDVIGWGMADGKANPLPLAEKLRQENQNGRKKQHQARPEPEAPPEGERLTIRASEIVPKAVRWLWRDRVAIDFISLFAGRTGLGKSFVTCDMAARLTTAGEMPDGPSGMDGECADVLFISEDPYEYVLAPRLLELGADMDRVHFLRWEYLALYTLSNIEFLERAYHEANDPALIVIDPPTNYLGDTDEHKNAEVRAVLTNLVAWLNGRDVACVLITHVNKQVGKGTDAINRILGSVAWGSTARVAMSFAVDPNDPSRCLFSGSKNNLGQVARTWGYRVVKTEALAKVEWLGEVDTTADEAMAGEKRAPRRMLAKEWLVELFRKRLEWPSDQFWSEAKAHGISKNAIDEARVRLEMPKPRKVTEPNGETHWIWWVPANWPAFTQVARDDADAGDLDDLTEVEF
jgi:hypothetical protein